MIVFPSHVRILNIWRNWIRNWIMAIRKFLVHLLLLFVLWVDVHQPSRGRGLLWIPWYELALSWLGRLARMDGLICCIIKRSSSLVVPGYWIYEVGLGSVTTAFAWGWVNVTLASSHCIILLSSKPFILLIFILYKLSHISWPTLVSDFKMFLLPFFFIHQSSHTFIIRVIKWILYSLFLYLNWVPRRKSFSRTFWISWTIFFLKHWLFSGLPSRCSNTVLDHFRL